MKIAFAKYLANEFGNIQSQRMKNEFTLKMQTIIFEAQSKMIQHMYNYGCLFKMNNVHPYGTLVFTIRGNGSKKNLKSKYMVDDLACLWYYLENS